MGAATWSPLASGILTGKHNRQIAEGSRLTLRENAVMQRLKEELLSNQGKNKLEKVENLKPIANRLNATLAQLALAWCLKQSNVNTVITGVSKTEQIYENINAVGLVSKLTPEILEEIESVLDNKPPMPFNFRDS